MVVPPVFFCFFKLKILINKEFNIYKKKYQKLSEFFKIIKK